VLSAQFPTRLIPAMSILAWPGCCIQAQKTPKPSVRPARGADENDGDFIVQDEVACHPDNGRDELSGIEGQRAKPAKDGRKPCDVDDRTARSNHREQNKACWKGARSSVVNDQAKRKSMPTSCVSLDSPALRFRTR
jgi:hypothetical protein